MNAICLLVAGALRATLPVGEFTLNWQHSVEKTLMQERYRVSGERLALVEARVQGFGAGVEAPPDAVLQGGWWSWRPQMAPLAEIHLTRSSYTRDYELCWSDRCASLSALIGAGEDVVVSVRPCQVAPPTP